MNIPTNVREVIVAELRKPGSVDGAIARRYGLTLADVNTLKVQEGLAPESVITPVLFNIDRVPEHLRPYVVAIKPVAASWPTTDRVRQAQDNYDAGLSETAVGRVRTEDPAEDLLYFCEFPRKRTASRRRPYFSQVAA